MHWCSARWPVCFGSGQFLWIGMKMQNENEALQRQAVELVGKYRAMLMMAPPVKAFFKRLAVFLKWEDLEKSL